MKSQKIGMYFLAVYFSSLQLYASSPLSNSAPVAPASLATSSVKCSPKIIAKAQQLDLQSAERENFDTLQLHVAAFLAKAKTMPCPTSNLPSFHQHFYIAKLAKQLEDHMNELDKVISSYDQTRLKEGYLSPRSVAKVATSIEK